MLLLLLAACGGTLTTIDVDGTTKTTVEAGSIFENLLGDLGFDDWVSMDITAAQELRNQGVEPGDINSAVLTLLTLEAVSGSPDLSFLHSMTLSVESPDTDAQVVASCDSFPEGQASVSFDLTGADITAAVVSQSLSIVTDVDAQRPEVDTTIQARYNVAIGVTVQGAKRAVKER